MNPVAFSLFGMEIRWYGIIIAIGFLVAIFITLQLAKKTELKNDDVTDWMLWLIPFSIVGARIHYVIFTWNEFDYNLMDIINTRNGGLAIHGGIIISIIVSVIFCKIRKMDFWELADITAPGLVLAQGIGRWGNYMNQEAYGSPTDLPWGIMIDGIKVHPTFLYESICDVLIFLFLIWYTKRKKVKGEIFLLYIALYSTARFFIEQLRTDSLYIGNLRIAQVISVVSILLSMGILFYLKNRKTSQNKEI